MTEAQIAPRAFARPNVLSHLTSACCCSSDLDSFFFSSRRRHTRFDCDWSSDVCSSDLSDSGGDFLRFFVDGSNVQQISGEVPWTLVTYNVPAGTHALSWRYSKSGSTAAGSDRGWVDSVNWAPTRYTLTINSTGGTVTRNPNTADYAPGTVVTLTAVPNAGNSFVNWTGDINTTANPATITMSANRTVTANYGI